MLRRHNIVLNTVILVLALCVVFFACMPIRSCAEDDSNYGTELDWGYANADKGVKWTQYEDGDVITLVLELTGNGSSDKEKAITRLLDKNANSFVRDTLAKNTTRIVIKEGVTGIGWKAIRNNDNEPKYDGSYYDDDTQNTETDVFNKFTKLKEVEPCSTIKRIGWSAFRNCSNLESFDFSKCKDLEEIMNQAFNPSALTEADLSKCSKLKTIRTSAFNSITTLKSVTLPGSLEVVGKTAFGNCSNLETLTFEEGSDPKLVIWENAFSNIGIKSLTIPDSVSRIRRNAFEKCTKLKTVTFADTSVTELWQHTFSGDSTLDEVIDEATKKLAFTKPVSIAMFSNYPVNKNAFENTALLESIVDLGIEVKDKISDYNGDTQSGYTLTDTDHVTATGLVDPDKLTGVGYTPKTGKYKGSYGDGTFNKDQLEVKRRGYSTKDNYIIGTLTPGDLTINAVDLTITVTDQKYTYNGEDQGEDNKTYSDDSKVDVSGLKGGDAITSIKLDGHAKDAGEYDDRIAASDAAVGENGTATSSYNISYAPGKLTINAVDLTITVKDQKYTYNGEDQGEDNKTYSEDSKVDVSGLKGSDAITSIKLDGHAKDAGEYDDRIVASDAAVGTATGNYNIIYMSGKLTIDPADISTGRFRVSEPSDTVYSGTEQKKDVTVKDTETGKTLEDGTDYDIDYGDDVNNAGTVNVTIKGKGNYTGTVSRSYEITPAPLKVKTGSAKKTYDGKALKNAEAELTGLKEGDDATIKATGSQTIVGSSKNTYKITWGTAKESNYEIVKEKLGTLTVTKAPAPAPDDGNDDNGGGGGGNAITPAAGGGTTTPDTPADASAETNINDAPVPTTDTPEEPEVIDDPDVPLADNGGWALVNLLCMLGTVGLFVAMLARFIRKRQEGEYAGLFYVITGPAIAAFSGLVFFMTEDLKLPMIMTDKWTVFMAGILAVQLALSVIFRTRTADEDEEE